MSLNFQKQNTDFKKRRESNEFAVICIYHVNLGYISIYLVVGCNVLTKYPLIFNVCLQNFVLS